MGHLLLRCDALTATQATGLPSWPQAQPSLPAAQCRRSASGCSASLQANASHPACHHVQVQVQLALTSSLAHCPPEGLALFAEALTATGTDGRCRRACRDCCAPAPHSVVASSQTRCDRTQGSCPPFLAKTGD